MLSLRDRTLNSRGQAFICAYVFGVNEAESVTMASPITVLCVDDHPLMRDGIASAIRQQSDIQLVAEATNGEEAISAYRQFKPDVTLMDLQMPVMNGITAAAAIIKEFPQARIIILTTYSGDIQATRALQVGAKGFLLKGTLRAELIDTIRRVHAGLQSIPSAVAQDIAAHVGADQLTIREVEVLRCVSTGISNRAVGEMLGLSEDTVKGHMRNVLAKLHANDRTHAVRIALQRGYLEG
jgi:DNA-binding NarL/FixJ family response regulator